MTLVLPYLPYARADRRFTEADCFGLAVYGKLIDALGCDRVVTIDAHSQVAKRCIANFVNLGPEMFIAKTIGEIGAEDLTILLPDEGALNRYKIFSQSRVLHCQKHRDAQTGALSGFTVPQIETGKVLIVDDICDGGGTFLGIAEKIREQKSHVPVSYLYVTHGIFSKGMRELRGAFEKIFCTDSYTTWERSPYLEIFPIADLLDASYR